MKQATKIKIENYLKNLSTEIDILNYINVENIDIENPFDSIYENLRDARAFDIDIIYNYKAMEYLTQYDNSLSESLQIAIDFGYTLETINSEILASLLASKNADESFFDLQSEIEDFFIDVIKSEF